jgi:hypothetical protein
LAWRDVFVAVAASWAFRIVPVRVRSACLYVVTNVISAVCHQYKKGDGVYLIGNWIHLRKGMDNSLVGIMFGTPHPRAHNPVLAPKRNHTNNIPPTPLDGRNIKPERKPCCDRTAHVHGQFAVVAVDDCAAGFGAEGAGGCPAVGGDGAYSLDGFEEFGVCEAGFGVEEGAGYVRPVVVCCGFQGRMRR